MKRTRHISKKLLTIFMAILLSWTTLSTFPNQASANDNNLGHTSGAKAAALASFASASIAALQNLLLSRWGPNLPADGPVWRPNDNDMDVRQRLLRYDDRMPDEIFRDGFAPRNLDQDLESHEWDLYSYVAGNADEERTPFVSTTRPQTDASGEIISQWTPEPGSFFDTEYLYEIFAPGGIDVNASLGGRSPSPEQLEIAFPGGIRPEYIRSVRQMRYNEETGRLELDRIIMNPNFVGMDGLPEVIVPTGIPVEQWNPERPSSQSKANKSSRHAKSNINPMKRPGKQEPDPFKNNPTNPRRIPNGDFEIRPILNTQKAVIYSADVELYQDYHSSAGRWRFKYDAAKQAYQIQNLLNPDANTMLTRDPRDNRIIGQIPMLAGDNGYWKLEENTDGSFTIRCLADPKLVLDLDGSLTIDKTSIIAYQDTGGKNQKWKIDLPDTKPIADGVYQISSSIDSNKIVDLSEKSPEANVYIFTNDGLKNQRWYFQYNKPRRAYKIINIAEYDYPGLILARNPQNNNVFVLREGPSTDNDSNTYWQLNRNSDGSMTIANEQDSSLVLDLNGWHTEDRSNITVYQYTGNKNQKWNIEKISTNVLSNGKYQITTPHDFSKVVQARSAEDKSPVEIGYNQDKPSQVWDIQYSSTEGAYTLQTLNPFKRQFMKRNLSNNTVHTDYMLSHQDSYWVIEERKNGSYVIRSSENTDLALDGGSLDLGNALKTNKSIADSQIWDLHRADKPLLPDGNYTISTKLNYKKVIDANDKDASISDYLALPSSGWRLRYDKDKLAYKIYTEAYLNKGLVYQKSEGDVSVDDIDGSIDPINEDRRYWTIEYNEIKGGYQIRSLYNPTEAINLPNGDTTNNTKINTFTINNLETQLWNIAPKKPN